MNANRRTRPIGVFVVLVAASFAGCAKPTTAPVAGKVRYKSDNLLSGMIVFQSEDGRIGRSNIQADGSYSIPDAPIGNVKITVQTFQPPPQVVPPDKIHSVSVELHRYIKIPEDYADFERSGLRYTVQLGKQTHDVDLE